MNNDEADRLLAFLADAGVEVQWYSFHLPSRKPIPADATAEFLIGLPGDSWDAEPVAEWVVLPTTDGRATAVDAARDRYFADPKFAAALHEAHDRRCERECIAAADAAGW